MDVMVHNTLVKLCTDHFVFKDIEAARQLLYSYDAITKLNLKESRRRQGPAKDKTNVENILLALRMCRSGLPKFVVTIGEHANLEHRRQSALPVMTKYSLIDTEVSSAQLMTPVFFDESKHVDKRFVTSTQTF